jgi:predicted GIY-YIG superfamily endonuclease
MKSPKYTFTREELLARARKYKHKTDWKTADRFAHWAARKIGKEFYAECTAHMPRSRTLTEFTGCQIREAALRYRFEIHWIHAEPKLRHAALVRGKEFYAECTAHMPKHARQARSLKAYSNQELLDNALLYKNRTEWKTKDEHKRRAAYIRGHDFYEKCCAHMKQSWEEKPPYHVYVFVFEDKSAYVGYTHDWITRRRTHSSRGPVAKLALKGLKYQFMLMSTSIGTLDEAAQQEIYWHDKLKASGLAMLNVKKCGGKEGSLAYKYTVQQIIDSSLKCESYKKWILEYRAYYRAALKFGPSVIKECLKNLKSKRYCSYLTKEEVLNDALKYRTRLAWEKANPYVVYQARKFGKDFLAECRKHMLKPQELDITKEQILESARKFKCVSDWQREDQAYFLQSWKYDAAFRSLCRRHMKRANKLKLELYEKEHGITDESILLSAEKYVSPTKWAFGDRISWRAARRRGTEFCLKCRAAHQKAIKPIPMPQSSSSSSPQTLAPLLACSRVTG